MVATCGVGAMLYVLPMMLGRTYDFREDAVGLDIFSQEDIDDAMRNPIENKVVISEYLTVEQSSEKRSFMGISGELGIKIASGIVNIKGAGEYLKDVSNTEQSIELMIKLTFMSEIRQLSPDAKPMAFLEFLDPKTVGTHVITSVYFGGEIYAAVRFTSLKSEYTEEIKGDVRATFSKSGAFDVEAQGKLEMLAQNMSSKAKMELDYYGTVPLGGVPTSIEGLRELVDKFKDQVESINDGAGVPICVAFRPLEDFYDKFRFLKNRALVDALESFGALFDGLREASGLLGGLIKMLPIAVDKAYFDKVIDFSGRLTKTLRAFYEVIGNLNLEEGSEQLSPALEAFDENSDFPGNQKYTREVRQLIADNVQKDEPNHPRAVYVHWGKKTCGNKASNALYAGYMTSFIEKGIGAGTNYLCLPEEPDLTTDPDAVGLNVRTTKLGAVRYMNMSMFKGSGKQIEDKVTPCVVCETPNRPTVQMFPSMNICPGDWVPEYSGFIVGNFHGKLRSEFMCVDGDPDVYNITTKVKGDPVILPAKVESNTNSVPCAVCSK